MAHAKEPLTRGTRKGGSELTDRGRVKLRGQITRAERIMRVEGERNSTGEVYRTAARMKRRAQELLGETPKTTTSPGKPTSRSDVHAKRREPLEEATGTDRTKRFLQEVAKKAERANRGE